MNQSVRTYSFVYSRNDLGRIERANRNKNLTSRIDVTFLAIKYFGGRSRRDMFGHKMIENVTSRRTTRSGRTGSDRPILSTQTAGCGYRFGDAVGVVRSSLSTRLRLERDRPAQDQVERAVQSTERPWFDPPRLDRSTSNRSQDVAAGPVPFDLDPAQRGHSLRLAILLFGGTVLRAPRPPKSSPSNAKIPARNRASSAAKRSPTSTPRARHPKTSRTHNCTLSTIHCVRGDNRGGRPCRLLTCSRISTPQPEQVRHGGMKIERLLVRGELRKVGGAPDFEAHRWSRTDMTL
jgi:hypothetical protein